MARRRHKRRHHVAGFGILPAIPLLLPLLAGGGLLALVAYKKFANVGAQAGTIDPSLVAAAADAAQTAQQAQATLDALNAQAKAANIVTVSDVGARAAGGTIPTLTNPSMQAFALAHSPLAAALKLNGYILPPGLHGFLP